MVNNRTCLVCLTKTKTILEAEKNKFPESLTRPDQTRGSTRPNPRVDRARGHLCSAIWSVVCGWPHEHFAFCSTMQYAMCAN